jgi:hypothetical protein
MKKSDGKTPYMSDIAKVVKATLFLFRLFIRDKDNFWMMDTPRAKAYEIKNLGEEYVGDSFDGCRIPTEEEINEHYRIMKGAP